ncbi:hypothetical protein TNIN_167391 [Trichonephila inaurata madagascariensis]|uniref:UDENN FLCN/SMCR8-type domain-containing protein n=1 Tax=Trichonephila inaurata madagascariensis TaxID=2747483 RepID=A0A8X7CMM2_9ARAC|nr:hypothetical protein TNIN_167391 [Trichonephila inaurata madagascariensis]
MLWSPNEVLAYLKDDLGAKKSEEEKKKLLKRRIQPFGGFETWPKDKDDFILIAENSEIHGPNPLFTIPELDTSIDLNSLCTRILSADFQGLSNNKKLPRKNAQLLMPHLTSQLHGAINYFFLFDSEARGFVRPTCIAYFTYDKHKLIQLAGPILKTLGEGSMKGCSNFTTFKHILPSGRFKKSKRQDKNSALDAKNSNINQMCLEMRLKDVQDVVDFVENYQGNEVYDKMILNIMENLKKNNFSYAVRKLDLLSASQESSVSVVEDFTFRPNVKKFMKNLFHICSYGVVLGLYHLHVMHEYFKRKYQHIFCDDTSTNSKGYSLHFGACIKVSPWIPSSLSLDSDQYFDCLDHAFEKILLNFIEKEEDESNQNISLNLSSLTLSDSSDMCSSSSNSSGYLSMEEGVTPNKCRHTKPLHMIWDVLDYITVRKPDIEKSFLQVLKLFNETRRKKEEVLFVDPKRENPLTKEDLSKFAVINFCLGNKKIEDIIPLEMMSSLCILNLKDCSFTGPTYTGCILEKVDQQMSVLRVGSPVFPILVNILIDVDSTIKWWYVLNTCLTDTSKITKYVLSKGYNRFDMQIIEKLYRMYRH